MKKTLKSNIIGATLIELMVTLVIIAILFIIAAPIAINHIKESDNINKVFNIRLIEDSISSYDMKNKSFPLHILIDRISMEKVYESSRAKELFSKDGPVEGGDFLKEVDPDEDFFLIDPEYILATSNSLLEGGFISNLKGQVFYMD